MLLVTLQIEEKPNIYITNGDSLAEALKHLRPVVELKDNTDINMYLYKGDKRLSAKAWKYSELKQLSNELDANLIAKNSA